MAVPRKAAGALLSLGRSEYGKRLMANLLDSLDEGLVDVPLGRAFLRDLAEELAQSNDDVDNAVWRVCLGIGNGAQGYVRSAAPISSSRTATVWTSLATVTDWADWHVDKHLPSSKPLPAFPPISEADFDGLVRGRLLNDWASEGAMLGRPRHGLCQPCPQLLGQQLRTGFGLQHCSQQHQRQRTPSTRSLGYGVAVGLTVRQLGTIPRGRPGCPKRDRPRRGAPQLRRSGQRVVPSSCQLSRSRHYGRHGWGSTVNLTVIRARRRDDTGRPERVVAPIPLQTQLILGVDWLPAEAQNHQKPRLERPRPLRYPTSRFIGTRPFGLKAAALRMELGKRLWP